MSAMSVIPGQADSAQVNAVRRNYEQATEALAKAEPSWLSQLISRRVPLSSWPDALTRQPGDEKVTVDLRD